MTSTRPSPASSSDTPVAIQRGRRGDRLTLAKLRVDRRWLVRQPALPPGAALLVLRVVVGATFLLHGLQKLDDLAGTEQFFASLSIPAPGLMSPLVAVTEVVGGVLLIAGLATVLAGAALVGDMLVAIGTAHLGHGFFVADGGPELALLLAGACLTLSLAGAGRYSVDAVAQRAGR